MATKLPEEQPQQRPQINTGSYFKNIGIATRTLLHGLKLTWRHFVQARESRKPMGVEQDNYFEQQTGIFTLQYPKESLPVPDNARYRLHNEIEDCIVCDKCAKVCPVDCIEIEPIKAIETIGQTSDGTPKRIHAARFDIDMGKCCFCGLCTTVCPTECLTMTKVYDFSEFDVADHTYAFAEMTPLEIVQKRRELEEYQAQKEAQKAARPAAGTAAAKPGVVRPASVRPAAARPAAPMPAAPKPGAPKPATPEDAQETARKLMEQKNLSKAAASTAAASTGAASTAAEVPNPTMKSAPTPEGTEDSPAPGAEKPKFRPRPMMKPKTASADADEAKTSPAAAEIRTTSKEEDSAALPSASTAGAAPKPRPVMRPVMKPVVKKSSPPADKAILPAGAGGQPEARAAESSAAQPAASSAKPSPVIKPKPVIKKAEPAEGAAPKQESEADQSASADTDGAITPDPSQAEAPKQSAPASVRPRPVMKPVIRKASTPGAADHTAAVPAEDVKKPRPLIKPVIPKQPAMQADSTSEKREANEQEIKKPRPVVEKKEVTHKPAQEELTEEEKRQLDSQKPEPPGRAGQD
ncbi:NADH dehydrogenase I subunit I [Flammeovirgaceae bacterium 311]|nr:NADH dehydrogenase I subunit I [Flammeovirgaceae bacterium 311]